LLGIGWQGFNDSYNFGIILGVGEGSGQEA